MRRRRRPRCRTRRSRSGYPTETPRIKTTADKKSKAAPSNAKRGRPTRVTRSQAKLSDIDELSSDEDNPAREGQGGSRAPHGSYREDPPNWLESITTWLDIIIDTLNALRGDIQARERNRGNRIHPSKTRDCTEVTTGRTLSSVVKGH